MMNIERTQMILAEIRRLQKTPEDEQTLDDIAAIMSTTERFSLLLSVMSALFTLMPSLWEIMERQVRTATEQRKKAEAEIGGGGWKRIKGA